MLADCPYRYQGRREHKFEPGEPVVLGIHLAWHRAKPLKILVEVALVGTNDPTFLGDPS
jgi:hypothetical protein